MPVMTALVLAVLTGIAVIWTKAAAVEKLLKEIQAIVLAIVNRVIVPVLPFFIAATFAMRCYAEKRRFRGALFRRLCIAEPVLHEPSGSNA